MKTNINKVTFLLYQLLIFLNIFIVYFFQKKRLQKKPFLPAGSSWLFFISPNRWIGNEQLFKVRPISLNRLKSAILRWRFLAGNGMERTFENQECIKVSLQCVYNCSLVLKTENKRLSKAINVNNLNPSRSFESALSVAQWVWMAPLALSETTSGQNFGKIGSFLGDKGPRLPETPQKKPHFLHAPSTTKKFRSL